jgi:murein DD-endopeptidase MepM/ murein hydrolase activator NlpD
LNKKNGFIPLFKNIEKSEYIRIDLSKNNDDLTNIDLSIPENLENYIDQYLAKKNSKVAYGGYLEHRNLYNHNLIFSEKDQRNIHLGVDFWIDEETAILTPFDGVVHSFANNTNDGDYGPTIILKHIENNKAFYTLYGHLSLDSIATIKVGSIFKKGEILAKIGNAEVNGGYAPHLHFQIIKNIGEYKGDYPGVASANQVAFFKNNCPNPLNYLGLH